MKPRGEQHVTAGRLVGSGGKQNSFPRGIAHGHLIGQRLVETEMRSDQFRQPGRAEIRQIEVHQQPAALGNSQPAARPSTKNGKLQKLAAAIVQPWTSAVHHACHEFPQGCPLHRPIDQRRIAGLLVGREQFHGIARGHGDGNATEDGPWIRCPPLAVTHCKGIGATRFPKLCSGGNQCGARSGQLRVERIRQGIRLLGQTGAQARGLGAAHVARPAVLQHRKDDAEHEQEHHETPFDPVVSRAMRDRFQSPDPSRRPRRRSICQGTP